MILSFAEYQKKNINSTLLLLGDGPERSKLIKLAKKNDIYKKIIWVKYSKNVKDLLNLANVFVLPSRYEGFGMVFLEAMLTSTPIISTNASAIPEVIKHNYNGILIEPNNIKQMISALKKIQDKKTVKMFNTNSKKLLLSKFSLNKMYKKTNEIYYNVLDK